MGCMSSGSWNECFQDGNSEPRLHIEDTVQAGSRIHGLGTRINGSLGVVFVCATDGHNINNALVRWILNRPSIGAHRITCATRALLSMSTAQQLSTCVCHTLTPHRDRPQTRTFHRIR